MCDGDDVYIYIYKLILYVALFENTFMQFIDILHRIYAIKHIKL